VKAVKLTESDGARQRFTKKHAAAAGAEIDAA
jgi:hypothetical protein